MLICGGTVGLFTSSVRGKNNECGCAASELFHDTFQDLVIGNFHFLKYYNDK